MKAHLRPYAILVCYITAAVHALPSNGGELKVFVLAGQSNAEGQAEVATKDKDTGEYLNGTLAYQLKVCDNALCTPYRNPQQPRHPNCNRNSKCHRIHALPQPLLLYGTLQKTTGRFSTTSRFGSMRLGNSKVSMDR